MQSMLDAFRFSNHLFFQVFSKFDEAQLYQFAVDTLGPCHVYKVLFRGMDFVSEETRGQTLCHKRIMQLRNTNTANQV